MKRDPEIATRYLAKEDDRVLKRLLSTLSEVCAQADKARRAALRETLASAARDPALLNAALRASSSESYRRHILGSDPAGRFTVMSLVWLPGQHSPVHAHYTWCGLAVVSGTLTEIHYDWNKTLRRADPRAAHARAPGFAGYAPAGLSRIHCLRNLGDTPAVSLHVYGLPITRVPDGINHMLPSRD